MLKHYASNLLVDMNLEAKRETLDYIKAKMTDAPYFEKHPQLVHYVVDLADKEGLFIEFGVGRGKSIRWIASQANQALNTNTSRSRSRNNKRQSEFWKIHFLRRKF